MVASFLSDHEIEKFGELLRSGQINVLERTLNGAISIGAKSLDVKRSLGGEVVIILRHQVTLSLPVFWTPATTSTCSTFRAQLLQKPSLISRVHAEPPPYCVLRWATHGSAL